MEIALEEARLGASRGEVPVGAAVVCGEEVVARDHNRTREAADPTAHAEIRVLREAAAKQGDWRLTDCTLYVTLEPCAMCAGAIVLARIERLVFAADDPKAGMCGSLGNLVQDERLNHRLTIESGVLADESGELLREFFREKR
ncbi:MAG: nucleoside deaminase [Gemmatimonadota bacterium]|nr:MAG: nucleoside deaminase [Gemmatimonadota bacterium]